MLAFYITLAVAIVAMLVFVIAWKPNTPLLDFFLKGIATISVISLCAVSLNYYTFDTTAILLIIGLAFCMLGDVALSLREFNFENQESKIILSGELAFSFAQIVFIVMLAILSSFISLWGLLFGVVFAIIMLLSRKLLKLDFKESLLPSLLYAFLLASNVGGSLIWLITGGASLMQILLFSGFLMFIISDLILSKIYFGGVKAPWVQKVNYLAYYIAIILIAMCTITF
ncbi:MAG: hypothetical protein J6C13_05025 [Clostridia bacterium]|nr:hypothetical protein [Clostridia bacterium]